MLAPIDPDFVAVVIGASRGIGRGVAVALGARGARVYIAARTAAPGAGRWPGSLSETRDEIVAVGGVGISWACDAGQPDEVSRLFERVEREVPEGPHLLVNAAYSVPDEFHDTPRGIPFWRLSQSVWTESLGPPLTGAYAAARCAAALMTRRGSGLIVSLSSSGAEGYAFNVPYGVAKAAVERMTRDMAIELRPFGVAAVALRPGPVLTERIRLSPWDAEAAKVKRRSPRDVGEDVVRIARRTDLMHLSGLSLSAEEI